MTDQVDFSEGCDASSMAKEWELAGQLDDQDSILEGLTANEFSFEPRLKKIAKYSKFIDFKRLKRKIKKIVDSKPES
jgi:hypothetical protein